MKASDYIITELKKINDRIFMVTGGGAMHLNDSVGRIIPYTCTHHEQAAAIAAEGFARISGRPGLCLVTSGPGVTNAITGLYGAWTDSIPVIFISGQMRRQTLMRGIDRVRQIGDQEINAIALVDSLTKYSFQPAPKYVDIKYCLQKAWWMATHGRPGPVWLDIPLDLQAADIDPDTMANFIPPAEDYSISSMDMEQIQGSLKVAKRPLIIAGHGIRLARSVKRFRHFLRGIEIPFVTTINSIDLDFPRSLGNFGTLGTTAANTAVREADTILILGARMDIQSVGYEFGKLGKQAYKMMVDIDAGELNKRTFTADFRVLGSVANFFDQFNPEGIQVPTEWLQRCASLIMEDAMNMPLLPDVEDYVNPYRMVQELNRFLKSGEIIASTNGMISCITPQMLDTTPNMRYICNSGAGPMGYGLPLAIGAAFAAPEQRVICLEGDGSIQMNIQELQTVVGYNLPLKIIILNNGGYASIRNTQDNYFEGRYVGADQFSGVTFPDMEEIAGAYGIPYCKARTNGELRTAMNKLFNIIPGACICEIMGDPKAKIMPKGIKYE